MISVSPKSLGVKTRATPCSRSRRASLSGMIPPTTTGTSSRPASRRPSQHRRHDLQVRAGQDRQADDVHVLLDRGRDDLRRGEPDALVDRPRSRRRGRGRRSARRRWSARRGRACRPGSAAGRRAPRRWPAPARGRRSASRRPRRRRWPRPRPVGARYSPNTSRSTPAHSPVVTPARAQSRVAAIRFASVPAAARRASSAASTAAWSRSARHFRTASCAAASTAGSTAMIAASRSAVQRVGLGGLEPVDADDDVLAALDPPAALGQRADQRALHVAGLDGRDRAAHLLRPGPSRPGRPRRARRPSARRRPSR